MEKRFLLRDVEEVVSAFNDRKIDSNRDKKQVFLPGKVSDSTIIWRNPFSSTKDNVDERGYWIEAHLEHSDLLLFLDVGFVADYKIDDAGFKVVHSYFETLIQGMTKLSQREPDMLIPEMPVVGGGEARHLLFLWSSSDEVAKAIELLTRKSSIHLNLTEAWVSPAQFNQRPLWLGRG